MQGDILVTCSVFRLAQKVRVVEVLFFLFIKIVQICDGRKEAMTMPVRRNHVKLINSVVADWREVYIVDFYISEITVQERLY